MALAFSQGLFFALQATKNIMLLVLLFNETSLRPELSSPPRFRITRIHHERDGGAGAGGGGGEQAQSLIG